MHWSIRRDCKRIKTHPSVGIDRRRGFFVAKVVESLETM
nr:MAG TPA: hypothetical protein [Caudoviricetes sp.]